MATRNATIREAEAAIMISRVYAAPRALLWKAWTEPERIVKWWGPDGFGAPRCTVDLRPGGVFLVELAAPDGSLHPCTGIFREIVLLEKLVYDNDSAEGHACGAGIPPRSRVTVTFTDEGAGKTRVTLSAVLSSAAAKEAANAEGFSRSWAESFERLADIAAAGGL